MKLKMTLTVNFDLNEIKQNNQPLNNEAVLSYIKNKINHENLDYAVFTDLATNKNGDNKGFLAIKLSEFNKGINE